MQQNTNERRTIGVTTANMLTAAGGRPRGHPSLPHSRRPRAFKERVSSLSVIQTTFSSTPSRVLTFQSSATMEMTNRLRCEFDLSPLSTEGTDETMEYLHKEV